VRDRGIAIAVGNRGHRYAYLVRVSPVTLVETFEATTHSVTSEAASAGLSCYGGNQRIDRAGGCVRTWSVDDDGEHERAAAVVP
jgi:hypothetical protein